MQPCTQAHTHTSMASYPSPTAKEMSSPSWHSLLEVKPDSSGETTGGAGGGAQLPQHSPSAEPSERLLASRLKLGLRRGGWGFPNPQVSQELNRGSGARCVPGFQSQHSRLSLSANLKSTCVPWFPSCNFFPRASLNIPPCPSPPHCRALERSRISVCFNYRD